MRRPGAARPAPSAAPGAADACRRLADAHKKKGRPFYGSSLWLLLPCRLGGAIREPSRRPAAACPGHVDVLDGIALSQLARDLCCRRRRRCTRPWLGAPSRAARSRTRSMRSELPNFAAWRTSSAWRASALTDCSRRRAILKPDWARTTCASRIANTIPTTKIAPRHEEGSDAPLRTSLDQATLVTANDLQIRAFSSCCGAARAVTTAGHSSGRGSSFVSALGLDPFRDAELRRLGARVLLDLGFASASPVCG